MIEIVAAVLIIKVIEVGSYQIASRLDNDMTGTGLRGRVAGVFWWLA